MGIGVAEIVIILVVLVFVLGIPLVAGIALWSIYKRLMDVEIKLVEINTRACGSYRDFTQTKYMNDRLVQNPHSDSIKYSHKKTSKIFNLNHLNDQCLEFK